MTDEETDGGVEQPPPLKTRWVAPEKRVPLSFRVPASTKDRLNGAIAVFKHLTSELGEDPERVTLTYVAERILSGCLVDWVDELPEELRPIYNAAVREWVRCAERAEEKDR
jgi:hypothetical protein